MSEVNNAQNINPQPTLTVVGGFGIDGTGTLTKTLSMSGGTATGPGFSGTYYIDVPAGNIYSISASVEKFVEAMNAKAHELALTRTAFSTPHGLPMSKKERAASMLSASNPLRKNPNAFPRSRNFFVETAEALRKHPPRSRATGNAQKNKPR